MKTILRRSLAAAATLVAVLAAPFALATPTISFTPGAFPATGSPVALVSTPAGLNISVTAAPTAGSTLSQVAVTVNGTSIGIATGSAPYVVNWLPTSIGTFTISATVTDTSAITTGAGASTNTATISSVVSVTAIRVATLSAPSNNSTVTAGSQLFLRSSASMSDSIVQKVDFILDPLGAAAVLGTATQAPYNVAYTVTAGGGAHTLLARATASDGVTTFDSTTINLNVSSAVGAAPTVNLTAPSASSFVATGSTVTVSANASDADGFIPSTTGGGVTFFADGDPIGTDLTAPYSVSWTPTVAKVYSLRASATDDKGNSTLSAIPYNVTAVAALPTVSLTAGTTATIGVATTLSSTATASPGAAVNQVEFLENGVVLNTDTTAPYSFSWSPATIGTSVLTARVTDSAGVVVTSSAVNVTVSAAAPTISLTAPSSVGVNTVTPLSATATPGTGAAITQVQFLSGTTVLGTDTTFPYSFDWTPTATGTVSLTARVTDSNGTTTTSSAVSVTVAAAVPTVSLTAPAAGANLALAAATTLTATATANGGATVSRVDFLVGTTIVGTDLTVPYSFDWTPTTAGITALTAKVTDSNGVSATSSIVNVLVTAPSVSITAPTAGSTVTAGTVVAITATPVAPSGTVTKVDFFAGATLIDTSAGPVYSVNWTPSGTGAVSLTARVTDSNGATVTSAAVSVTVAAAATATVSVTAPAAGSVFTVGSNVTLSANATSAAGGTVAQVQFLVGTTIVGTDTTAPYSVTWIPSTSGNFSVTARVIDSFSNSVTSAPVTVTANTATSVSLTAPANNSTATVGTAVNVTASPAASLGNTVTSVTFFAGATQIGVPVTSAPYTVAWTPAAAGVVALSAQVLDSAAVTATSSAVSVTVGNSLPTVSLTTPIPSSVLTVNTATTLSANATPGSAATITRVDFLSGSTLLGSSTTAPFTFNWTPTATGAVSLTARVTDSNNAVVNSTAVSVTVAASGLSVSMTAPAANANLTGNATVTLSASASASAPATVASVAFFVDGNQVGALDTVAPYAVSWVAAPAGLHSIFARVTDSNGNTADSTGINVNVSAISLPAISITAPIAGSNAVVGAPVTITASAAPGSSGSITKVDFYADTTLIGTDTSSPYSIAWLPTAAGAPNLSARVTDSNNVTTTAVSVPIIVNPAGTPTITLSMVGGGGSLVVPVGSSRMLVAATADDGVVDRVDFYLDGVLLGTDGVAPYTLNYVASTDVGAHQFTAIVTDNSGLTTTSNAVAVTFVAAIGSAPTVRVLTPTDGAFATSGFVTTVNVIAADTDGTISRVEVFANGILLPGTALANRIWSTAWTPTAIGPASIVAIATDDKTNATVSAAANVTVTDNSAPTIALGVTPGINAATGTTLPAGATRNVVATVNAAVAGRAITRVEFFINGTTKVGEKVTAPYSYRFTAPTAPGIYVLTARATDNGGLSRDVYYTFNVTEAVGAPPTLRLLTPTANTTVVPNTAVTLAASAVAVGGSIANVQFYANGNPVGSPIAPPTNFATNYTPTTPGGHALDAIATDDRGNTTVSNSVNLTAAFGTPSIFISSPSTNVTARATPLVPFTITATATAGTGASVFLVEFLVDGQQVGTRLTPTAAGGSIYSFQWTPTLAQLGPHQITARVTDTNSFSATTPVVLNVNVANPVGAPPTLSAISPGNGAIIQSFSTVNFSVNATPGSNATITSVEFFLNDVSIGTGSREQLTSVYRRTFDFSAYDLSGLTINETTGRYPINLYVIARDSNGNQTIFPAPTATNPTPVLINLSPSISSPPSVTLQSFAVGGGANTVTIGTPFFMIATPVDSDGTVTSLQLFANGSAASGAIGNPQSPSLVTYTPSVAGNYNLYVVATDDSGNTAVSTPVVTLNVTAIPAPSTQLVSPTNNNTTTTVGAPVFLEATAVGANITQVPTVQFIASATTGQRTTINATRVGTTTTYRAIWTPTLADTYTVVSSSVVGSSPTATSTVSRRVVVNNLVGIGPTVSISVSNTVSSASTANLTATALDSDGGVSSVEFYLNRNSIGFAARDQLTNTWRLSASFVGVPLGFTEIVALVRDNSDNVAASPTSFINIVAATSLAPTFTTITATPNSVATGRQMQFTANARDTDGTVNVQYFANGVSLGTSGNANNSYLVNWTPTTSGTFTISAVATDNSSPANTAVAAPINVTVRRNNPIQDDTSFILQSYSDIANTTNNNPLVIADLADQLAAGTITRSKIVTDLMTQPGFVAPVNLLAAYWVLMGQWPTPTNYTALLSTTRNAGLSNGINSILFSNEYFLKYGVVPTTALLNSPTSVLPADIYIASLWRAAGLPAPDQLQNVQFRSNNVLSLSLGRGYNAVGLPAALAEFITNTNSGNAALIAKARAAALYYQIDRPPTPTELTAKAITDAIAIRIDALVKLPDDAARVDAVLKDTLYAYRYVTFVKHPQSLVVNPRSGAIFTVEAVGAPPILYQWLFNGTPIANATTATLSFTNVDTSRVGTYTVVVTTTAGSATSDPATLTLSNAPTRVSNISTRGVTNGGNQALIGGFVVAAPAGSPPNQTRQMLIRVVGPALNGPPLNLNVAGVLNNPSLEVFNAAGARILTNDNWSTQSATPAANTTAVTALQQATTRVGTFPLAVGSQDAAVLATLPVGSYTVQATGPNANSSGVVLIEVYDATPGNVAATSPRATNVATRGEVGTGANVLIAGFVINGTTSRRILLRGVGPTLNRFGIGQNALLADPFLTLKDAAGITLRTNDNWSTGDDAAVIAAAAVSGGAFALANGSSDAAMIVMLPPGAYTVQLSGVNNTTGIGIVEVYDIDP